MTWQQALTWLIPLISGGAFGALLKIWYDKRAARTQDIPLIERVNRIQEAPPGVKLVRTDSGNNLREITNVRTLQMTLHNTSNRLLRNDHVQFEFDSEDVEPWVSRPAKSNTPLIKVDAQPTTPWKKALRWQIPNLPPGDSVEFSFQIVDPQSDKYEAALYSSENVVLKETKGERTLDDSRREDFRTAIKAGMVLIVTLIGLLSGFMSSKSNGIFPFNAISEIEKQQNDAKKNADTSREILESLRHLLPPPQLQKDICLDIELLRKNEGLRAWCLEKGWVRITPNGWTVQTPANFEPEAQKGTQPPSPVKK